MMLKQYHSWRAVDRLLSRWRRLVVIPVILLVLAGCDANRGLQITAEVDEPHYRRGLQMLRSGEKQIALEAFLKVIDKRGGNAPESHLEAAQIYLTHIKDPIAAIYHFRKYLELRPNSPQAPQVWQLIETAKKEFARSLAAEPLGPQVERLDLLDALEKLKAENATLRAEIAKTGRTPPPATALTQSVRQPTTVANSSWTDQRNDSVQPVVPVRNDPAPARVEPQRPASSTQQFRPAATTGRTYIVQPKDTLYGISMKVYGTGGRWTSILEANRDQLHSARDLKIGMVLKIP